MANLEDNHVSSLTMTDEVGRALRLSLTASFVLEDHPVYVWYWTCRNQWKIWPHSVPKRKDCSSKAKREVHYCRNTVRNGKVIPTKLLEIEERRSLERGMEKREQKRKSGGTQNPSPKATPKNRKGQEKGAIEM